jgi:hypothetical protein
MKAPTLIAVASHRETEFSNPFPSSGESCANPTRHPPSGRIPCNHASVDGDSSAAAGYPFENGVNRFVGGAVRSPDR